MHVEEDESRYCELSQRMKGCKYTVMSEDEQTREATADLKQGVCSNSILKMPRLRPWARSKIKKCPMSHGTEDRQIIILCMQSRKTDQSIYRMRIVLKNTISPFAVQCWYTYAHRRNTTRRVTIMYNLQELFLCTTQGFRQSLSVISIRLDG